ncbi:Tm-1-like ATP-binding domain-containing protein [Rhizobium sp. RU36D]|uniref:Tm-1-like ATP-binding domain-containing protein n=1 Tax=Rhizobium sp. RU36D TaxID=1907415 RepID=UPI0009D7B4D8|nr:Tm-1-like ATP-binding domain-containing protein [Rhizobium sp. RU36D]SMC71715.1 transcriptional regulator [Rhizobium sp. RU36D]
MFAGREEPQIFIYGTGDTKADEIRFMASVIARAGGKPVLVDVSVLSDPPYVPDYGRHDIAAAAETTIEAIIDSGDENTAMALMARGAVALTQRLFRDDEIDGIIVLGGSMGTDLALDVAASLPLGVPKFVVSTIAYSHLVPPERISPDLMMILWAGGLFGLNPICDAVLAQACGAVVGAAKASPRRNSVRPLIGMTSLGSSCLKYMKHLKPELARRGYDLAVFHATGMGGRAFEALAADRGFAAVLDLCTQEVNNHLNGTCVTSGPDRLENAGRQGIPQIVAPGGVDMVDLQAWRDLPAALADRPYHAHNRLLGSVTTDLDGRSKVARVIAEKLARATGPTAFVLPTEGIHEWDKPGEPLHDPEGLATLIAELTEVMPASVAFHRIDTHINAPAFSAKVMEIFDAWVAEGHIPEGRP